MSVKKSSTGPEKLFMNSHIMFPTSVLCVLLLSSWGCRKNIDPSFGDPVQLESGSAPLQDLISFGGEQYEGQVIIQVHNGPSVSQPQSVYSIAGNISDENFDHIAYGDLSIGTSFSVSQTDHHEWNKLSTISNLGGSLQTVTIEDVGNNNIEYSMDLYFPKVLEALFPDSLDSDSLVTWNSDNNNARGLVLRLVRNVGSFGQSLGALEEHFIDIPNDDGSYTLSSSDLSFIQAGDEWVQIQLLRGDYNVDEVRSGGEFCAIYNLTSVSDIIPVR